LIEKLAGCGKSLSWFSMGLSIRHPQSGFSSADTLRTRVVLYDANIRTFWCKNFGFFKIYDVSAVRTDKGGEDEPVRTFFGQGGGSKFSRFCVDVFYE